MHLGESLLAGRRRLVHLFDWLGSKAELVVLAELIVRSSLALVFCCSANLAASN